MVCVIYMHDVDVSSFDLNLLVVLDALLASSSVTRAATTLGLSQPTVSHALTRLRRALGDPLFVRVGRAVAPTPRAEALAPRVRALLADVSRLLARDDAFDPATSDRALRIACPDLLAAFLPELLARIAREAPSVRVEAQPIGGDLVAALASRTTDLGIAPAREAGVGLVQRVLGTARWCVLLRANHPDLRRGRLTEDAWLSRPHVVVDTSGGLPSERRPGVIARAIEARGRSRRVGFIAPSSLSAMHAVAATDWFFSAPREIALPLARGVGLVAVDAPIPLPPIRVATLWHERVASDAGHRFLRDLVGGVIAAGLGAKSAKTSARERARHTRRDRPLSPPR